MKKETYRAFMKGIPARGPRCTEIEEPWDQQLRPPPKKKIKRTRKRKVTVERAMKQANKAGVRASAVTLNPDGSATVKIGETTQLQEDHASTSEWDEVLK